MELTMKYKYIACVLAACAINTASAYTNRFYCHDNWTGAYVGIQGGYGWGDAKWRFPFPEYYTTTDSMSFLARPQSTIGGAQIGYMYDIQSYVLGVEFAYISFVTLKTSETGPLTSDFPDDQFKTRMKNIYSITGRFGYGNDRVLPYAKVGYASLNTTISALSGEPGPGVAAEDSRNHGGWIAGVGFDWKVFNTAPDLLIGLEYNYLRLGNRTFSSTTTGNPIGAGLPFEVRLHNVNANIFTAHLSAKFF